MLLGVDVPADQPPRRVAERLRQRPVRRQQGRPLICVIAPSLVLGVLLRSPAARSSSCRRGVAEHRRVARRVRREQHHHADDGHRRPRLPAVPAHAVLLHLLQQHLRDHPVRPDAGERPHRAPAVPRPDRLGHLHRRRHQAAGPARLLQELAVPAGRARRRSCIARRPDRVRLDVHRPAASRWRSDSSPTCSPATCSWSPSRCSQRRCSRASVLVVILPFSFVLLVALTGFEILVGFLQAFIFTILTAVYIGGSMHPEH